MNTKLLTFAATGLAGITLGLGVGVAAAQQGGDDSSTSTSGNVASMDEMHDAMRDQMPADLADECDAMHDAMPAEMAAMDPDQMMRGMGQMMGGADMTGAVGHAGHHD